uniref:COP9 signalosome complex subunit 3 N-terminal helical repeats domain-containing protein n=1 Tax=Brassica oleracea TaxID=3712 RepID=A0A3P6AAD7_BRAOL|nr:unnamed protein product [Brassica oleracea]
MANTNLQEMVVGGDGAFDAIFHHSTQRWLEHDELDAVLDRQDQPNPPFNITVELLGPGPPFVEGLFSDNYDWTPVNRPRQLNCSSIRLGPAESGAHSLSTGEEGDEEAEEEGAAEDDDEGGLDDCDATPPTNAKPIQDKNLGLACAPDATAVTAPLYTVNAIALEAYKKYLLVTLIHSGQFSFSLPKCASTAAKSNFKTFIARDVRGVSSNPALIFSIARSEAVIDAYLDGLEASGLDDFSRVTSVASFFVSRVDTLMDKMLENIGTPEALDLRGKAAVAQAALAYQLYQKKFSGPRWEALVKKGAKKQRLLWASTSVKNPAYSDTIYVAPLIGPHTVSQCFVCPCQPCRINPVETFIDHGTVKRTIDANVSDAVYRALEKLGIDWNEVGDPAASRTGPSECAMGDFGIIPDSSRVIGGL